MVDEFLADDLDILDRKLKHWLEHETPSRYPAHRVHLAIEVATLVGRTLALAGFTERLELETAARRLAATWERAQRHWHEADVENEEDE